MSSGFNTDVQVGDHVFHVQTEDRGPAKLLIDTAVYQNGRVLLRRSYDYEQLSKSEEFSPEALAERVELQHRTVIDDIRSGLLTDALAVALEQTARAAGIQVQLLNPQSWLTGGTVSLEVEVARRADKRPEAGAQVEAVIEGALQESRFCATADESGRTKIEFPLPPLGKGDLALLIQASTAIGKDEIRFSMRSRAKTPASGAAQ
jgi:hypothetical protein